MNSSKMFRGGSGAGLFVVASMMLSVVCHAQTFDEAMARQLRGDCAAMGGENPTYFGPDLNAICSQLFGSPNGTANSGGGGASSQTQAVSVENRRKAQLEAEPAAELSDRLGVFVNANGETLNHERTIFADAYDSTVKSAVIGVDFRFTQQALVGVAYGYRNNSGDFGAGGDFDTTSNGGTLYLSIAPNAALFADFAVSYTDKSYEVNRRAQFTEFDAGGNTNNFDGIVSSDAEGTEEGAHAAFGYDFAIGRFAVGPRVGLNWSRTEIQAYAESGGGAGNVQVNGIRGAAGLALVYEDQRVDSLQGVLGAQASISLPVGFGAFVIQGNADYIREFEDDQLDVRVRFVQDYRPAPSTFQFKSEKPDENFFKVGLSTIAVFKGGIQAFLNLQAMVGNEQFEENYGATLGVRLEI